MGLKDWQFSSQWRAALSSFAEAVGEMTRDSKNVNCWTKRISFIANKDWQCQCLCERNTEMTAVASNWPPLLEEIASHKHMKEGTMLGWYNSVTVCVLLSNSDGDAFGNVDTRLSIKLTRRFYNKVGNLVALCTTCCQISVFSCVTCRFAQWTMKNLTRITGNKKERKKEKCLWSCVIVFCCNNHFAFNH